MKVEYYTNAKGKEASIMHDNYGSGNSFILKHGFVCKEGEFVSCKAVREGKWEHFDVTIRGENRDITFQMNAKGVAELFMREVEEGE